MEKYLIGKGSNLALAIICSKMLVPVKLPVAMAVTPYVQRCGAPRVDGWMVRDPTRVCPACPWLPGRAATACVRPMQGRRSMPSSAVEGHMPPLGVRECSTMCRGHLTPLDGSADAPRAPRSAGGHNRRRLACRHHCLTDDPLPPLILFVAAAGSSNRLPSGRPRPTHRPVARAGLAGLASMCTLSACVTGAPNPNSAGVRLKTNSNRVSAPCGWGLAMLYPLAAV